MKEVKKLDIVLNILLKHGTENPVSDHWITQLDLYKNYIHKEHEISSKELTEILSYLINDKSIVSDNEGEKVYFFTTLKGRMIKRRGGYEAMFKNESLGKVFDKALPVISLIVSVIALIVSIWKPTEVYLLPEPKQKLETYRNLTLELLNLSSLAIPLRKDTTGNSLR